ARPTGPLVWFHAASVGETQSILPLVTALLDARPDLHVLITSTTRTSADMLAGSLPDRVIHQVAPYDTARASRAFLDHWKPDVAIWVESELWPRMLVEVQKRGIPRLFLNARVSGRTARRWQRFARTARSVLAGFDEIHVQESATLDALASVGVSGPMVHLTGSLKQDRPPLDCDEGELDRLRAALGDRPVWCAASTHEGEDEIVLAAHRDLDGLLILVPRHAERAGDIVTLSRAQGFDTAQRSAGDAITAQTQVYVADTMGELGLWYRLAPLSFVGGSLVDVGGHNPYEPALLGSAVLHGPHVLNFQAVYDRLRAADAAVEVRDAETLSAIITALRGGGAAQMTEAALKVAKEGQGATLAALGAVLQRLP
ncbi:MAG: 3-deoxy-D-manno-octulosonic acid transferase, partial [Octadecabacter sp.]|nr:3-deoxy-D-manno-octulosonic acid transferase [Octadecabacter sp.]